MCRCRRTRRGQRRRELVPIRAREGGGPTLIECKVARYFGHYEGDTYLDILEPYIKRIKKELGGAAVWPVGYANEVMCYIPSERVLRENGYESGWSLAWGRGVAAYQMSGSGWNAPFALGLEDRIVSTVREMLKP
jgi:hypothetical protein